VLDEPRIQRYARQVLLRDVGERGQEALGTVRVELALPREVAGAAATYLRAGGSAVDEPPRAADVWADTPPLLGSDPAHHLRIVAAPAMPEGACIVLGARGEADALWSIAEEGCRACLRAVTASLLPPRTLPITSVEVGSLVALLVQRRALGLAPSLEGVEVSGSGALATLSAPVCTHRPPAVPASVLVELVRHLAAALPDEGCAVLLGRDDAVRLVPMENAQASHHARDPDAFPRTARTAFTFDPRAWLALLRGADAAGEQVLAIAHSHPDGGEHFSAEDRRSAAPDGRPLLPGVAHLVVAFRDGKPQSARWAVWTDGDFREAACLLPAGI